MFIARPFRCEAQRSFSFLIFSFVISHFSFLILYLVPFCDQMEFSVDFP
nr:MAG TPA: Protein of unknown function (DUF1201) [Caudoviricetes sp.]